MLVVCGEALMDVFGAGNTAAGTALDARVGGSPFNVAVGLARLAQPVAFLGTISTDFLGERLLRALDQEGVSTAAVARTAAPTTLGLVGLDAHGVPAYSFYGEHGADRQLTRESLRRLPADARAFHLGSYSLVVEPIGATLRELVESEHGRRLIAYDPNVRLNVEPDLQRWRDALRWMLPRTHLLKVSEEDLALLFPGAALQTLAADWLRQGVGLLVVTRGALGALAWTPSGCVEVPTAATEVVDTVGAGDTVQAALLTWLAENDCLHPDALAQLDRAHLFEAVWFAAQAAAITCARRGADMPRRHELPARREYIVPAPSAAARE
jgi:fructokinase